MSKIIYRLVYNRKGRLNARGEAMVQVEARMDEQRRYFGTNVFLSPLQWDKKRCVVRNHPNADALTHWMHDFMASIERVELELWQQGHSVTLGLLRNTLRKPRQGDSFLAFFRDEVQTAAIKPSTRKNQLTTLVLLQEFRRDISFCEVSFELVSDFERFLLSKGYHVNTVAKHIKHLKRYVNLAINKERLSLANYPFRKFRIKTAEYHHSHLTPDELKRLEAVVPDARFRAMRRTQDAFLFCCYVGLRYSDFTHLNAKNLILEEGKEWLVFRTVKTGIQVRCPIYLLFGGKALAILNRYRENLNEFFCLKDNSNVNKQLNVLGQMAGIEKHISFHTARHTNATLLIYSGVNITTVQRLLGHRSVKTTQGYTEVMDSTVIKDLQKHKWV